MKVRTARMNQKRIEEPVKAELEHRPPREELERFIGSIPGATFFHTPAWLDSLEKAFGDFRVLWLTAREAGVLAGVMPVVRISRGPFLYLWSLPFGTYGEPLAMDGRVREALLAEFLRLARAPACLEAGAVLFRGESPARAPHGSSVMMEECRLVSLEKGFDEVWNTQWSSKRRQLARRGLDAGVVVRSLETEEEVKRFHAIYAGESRAWGGVHPYPERLFLELFRRRSGGVLFWGAFLNNDLLGGHIDFYHGEMAQAWQGGMTERAREFETGAILIKSAMEEACRRGCRVFNLGSSGGNRGILFFKESLGGREHRYAIITARKRWWALVRARSGA
jgi:hypothetical protein